MSAPDAPDTPDPPPPTSIAELIESRWVTEPTRRAIRARLDREVGAAPRCLSEREFAVLAAALARLVPQPAEREAPLAQIIDANLAENRRDGWRYDAMPPDQEAYRLGLGGLDETGRALFAQGFVELGPAEQDAVLSAVQDGSARAPVWAKLPPARFFEELLAEAVEAYAAHPFGQDAMGYRGMADAEGFWAIGLNRRDPVDA